jgi:hypothetical protein
VQQAARALPRTSHLTFGDSVLITDDSPSRNFEFSSSSFLGDDPPLPDFFRLARSSASSPPPVTGGGAAPPPVTGGGAAAGAAPGAGAGAAADTPRSVSTRVRYSPIFAFNASLLFWFVSPAKSPACCSRVSQEMLAV